MWKHALWAVVVKNSVVVICWTALAIIFGKWWIALFSAAFVSGMEVKTKAKEGNTPGDDLMERMEDDGK